MKAAKLRELSQDELTQRTADLARELQALEIRKSASHVEQPSRIRALRRDIARTQTILRERKGQQG